MHDDLLGSFGYILRDLRLCPCYKTVMLLLSLVARIIYYLRCMFVRIGNDLLSLGLGLCAYICAGYGVFLLGLGKLFFIFSLELFCIRKRILSAFVALFVLIFALIHKIMDRLVQKNIEDAEQKDQIEQMQQYLLNIDI